MKAEDIIFAARSQIDVPFRHQGRLSGRSLDCAGLGVHVARSIGAEFIDDASYGRYPNNGLFAAALDRQPCLEKKAVELRQPGDLLLMRFAGEPQHLAVLAHDTIIHCYLHAGKVCEHRLSLVWAARIVAVYRFKDMA